ncbi:MAG TPA: MarC family protein [Pyrodictium sp.]|nr:MarC family protein [Pyrodictium sp.]HIQ10899.1 MarC family protein [Pyrodictium sp.]HIQ55601.1 MarC family protein [Pyrodictium sp.]
MLVDLVVNWEGIVKSAIVLLLVTDPIGNAPIFYSVTYNLPSQQRKRIIIRSVEVATLILLMFAFLGDTILSYFHITVDDFRIAGGLILLVYGVVGIMGYTEAGALQPEEAETIAIVPLATPLLAGPAAIATVLYIRATYGIVEALVAITINAIAMLALLLQSEKLLRLLGRSGGVALSRIVSILLAAFAVSMIREGIVNIMAKLSR